MPKHLVMYTLLALLALQNNSIYKQIYVNSHPSNEIDVDSSMLNQHHQQHNKPHRHHHQKQQQQVERQQIQLHNLNSHHQRHHRRVQRSHQQQQQQQQQLIINHQRLNAFEQEQQQQQQYHQQNQYIHSNEDEDLEDKVQMLRHYKRHIAHQQAQELHNRKLYNQRNAMQHDDDEAIEKTDTNKVKFPIEMFNDEPINNNNSNDNEQQYDSFPIIPETEQVEEPIDSIGGKVQFFNTEIENSLSQSDNNVNLNESDERNDTNEVPVPTTMRCPKCESSRQVAHVTEEELTRLRIDFVKQQILEKLRLKERPKVSPVRLPKPIYEGTAITPQDENIKNKDDEYYARTNKKYIFLTREQRECSRIGVNPSMCFSFKIDDADADADGLDVNGAVLWIFIKSAKKSSDKLLVNSQTIVVSEVQQELDAKYIPIVKTIAIKSVNVQNEWIKVDIQWPIKRWLGNHDLSHLIQITCQSCGIDQLEDLISIEHGPIIAVDTQSKQHAARRKRSINCTDGVTECCREKLYISFDAIGWGDWIIEPRGYDAYFCRGLCGSVASITQSSSHHNTFMQKLLSTYKGHGSKPLELIPCCTAKQYSSLQLVFMDSNNTATLRTFPNMVVESCGCR